MTRTPEWRVTPAVTPTRRPHGTARGVWDSCRNLGVDRERPISDLPDPLATAVGGESRDFSLSAHFEQLFSFFAVSIRMTECCSGLAHDHHALYLHIPPHERSFASRREHRTGTLLAPSHRSTYAAPWNAGPMRTCSPMMRRIYRQQQRSQVVHNPACSSLSAAVAFRG